MGWEDPASLAPKQTKIREPLLSSLGVHPHVPLLSLCLSSVHLPLGCETRLKEETENQEQSLCRAALAFNVHTGPRVPQPSAPFCPLGEGPDIGPSDPPPLVLPFVVHELRVEGYPSHTLSVPWGTGGMFYKTLIVRDSRFPENSRAKTHGR